MSTALPYPYNPDPRILRTVTPLWAKRGGWVTDISAVDYDKAVQTLGVKVFYVERTEHNINELHKYGESLKQQYGIQIAGWSALNVGDDPAALAKADVEMVALCKLDGWISDHEFETEAHMGYADQWIANFRSKLPSVPLGMTCMPGPRPPALSPQSWLNAGADIFPQCYQGEVGDTGAVWWSANYWLQVMRLPRVRLRVALGVDKNVHPWSMEQYISDMKAWGLGGYSLWHLEAIAPAGG